MFRKHNVPLLISLTVFLEVLIYFWAYWTSTLTPGNFFAIEPEFIFDKCARNSGRVSSLLNLIILLMIGYTGLDQIYKDPGKKDTFRILLTLFAVNHLLHFFYVFQTFNHHSMPLGILSNLHGFITFICVLIMPFILWTTKNLSRVLYILILLHLFNVSYFIMETFYNKITREKPAYHNQFGIAVTTGACIYVLYRAIREFRRVASTGNGGLNAG